MNIAGNKIAVFVSGGLVAWAVCRYLKDKGADVTAFWANVGQKDEFMTDQFFLDMEREGIPVFKKDLREQMAQFGLQTISYGAVYEGGYSNSTGAIRYVIIKNFAPEMQAAGFAFFAHGCVGGGNDQLRFESHGKMFLPSLTEIVMWNIPDFKDTFGRGRSAMVEYIQRANNYEGLERKIAYSSDGCVMGTSHEGTGMEYSDVPYTKMTPIMSVYPWNVQLDGYRDVLLGFEKGVLVGIDGERKTPFKLMEEANDIAGQNGMSLKTVFENRINLSKGRGIYESPGFDLIRTGFQTLLDVTLDYRQRELYMTASKELGRLMYSAQWEYPASIELIKKIETLTNHISGTLEMRIFKGSAVTLRVLDFVKNNTQKQQMRFAYSGGVFHDGKAALNN